MANETAESLPTLECDLVMKGGITSGIVYPPALQELAQKYRFRQVGGTSAGAIAAACAAAAEYGRESETPDAGFNGLGKVSDWLGSGTNLLDLFQPSPETRPLFKTFLALAASGSKGKKPGMLAVAIQMIAHLTRALVRYDTLRFIVGAIIGCAIAIILRWLTLNGSGAWLLIPTGGWALAWALVGLIFFAWLGGVLASAVGLLKMVADKVPQNFFGMCSGSIDSSQPGAIPVLTDWLHETIQKLAGLEPEGEPLTFGALNAKGITLKMVSTNLSEGQPYKLPFEQNLWIFHEDEMHRLFPPTVVAHLIKHAHKSDRISLEKLPKYHFLPEADDLPVTVGMRMSLSFPVLISAMPLWGIRGSAYKNREQSGKVILTGDADLERHWFSDGGISSNFPIHFFDAWLPHRPTFGINLRSMPPAKAREHVEHLDAAASGRKTTFSDLDGQVFLPMANAPQHPEIQPLPGLADFLGAIWNTAQNYHDNMQSLLPSYRERIVNIRMADDEGGLNLTMDPSVVKNVQAKGAAAGKMLRDNFDLQTHQWVRFQVLMPLLEQQLKHLAEVLNEEQYKRLLIEPAPDTGLPYDRSAGWRTEAAKRVAEILQMMPRWKEHDDRWLVDHQSWGDECFFPYKSPKPDPVMKVSPNL